MERTVWVIDPTSMEENRGSFCYLPYYLVTAYNKRLCHVHFLEDFRVTEKDLLDDIQPNDLVLISLWSYPQIDLCRLLHMRLPQAEFFGYKPLILNEKLPCYDVTIDDIRLGIEHYSEYADTFQYLLLSDCDGHLKDRPVVFPLCTSYGCVNGCSFCPVTPNLPERKRIVSDPLCVNRSIEDFQKLVLGSGIHYTDEDFFFDKRRAYDILLSGMMITERYNQKPAVIALASVGSFTRFLDQFETDKEAFRFCKDTGLFLIEIGLESADPELSAYMGKASMDKSIALAERVKDAPFKILWLSLTLSPGETISSIRSTGIFLHKYGLDPQEMSPRIRTNGTYGGLGQFFQLYHGARDFDQIQYTGKKLSERQTRLIPSFIPNSLISCNFRKVRDITEEDMYWLNLYNVPLFEFIEDAPMESVRNFFYRHRAWPSYIVVIFICIMARIGVIEQV